jgi:hypothetical protein
MIIVKSKLSDSICKDEKVTFMEVSDAIIYSLVTYYIIAYKEEFVFNIDYTPFKIINMQLYMKVLLFSRIF